MKNIQVIDGADNSEYAIFAVSDEEFLFLFPDPGQDIEFIEDVVERAGEEAAGKVLGPVWKRRIRKSEAHGVHGTLFYELHWKKKYYPTKRESEMRFARGGRL